MTPATLRGQGEALGFLRAVLQSGHVGHAYLFHGPAGVGKTRAALWLAQALLCEAPEADRTPCGRCPGCRDAGRLRHPDLDLLVPLPTFRTEGRTEKQADEARAEARARVAERYASEPFFTPVFAKPAVHSIEDMARAKQFLSLTARREGGAKVLIVKRAEAMTIPAANAFLKMLEEPQPGRVLILGASRTRALLPTVRSRCIPVRFAPLPVDFIASALVEARGLSRKTAALAAATAQGSLARAVEPFEPPLDGAGKEPLTEEDFARLRATAIDLFVRPRSAAVLGPLRRGRLDRDRPRFLSLVALALHYYRDVIHYRLSGGKADLAHADLAREVAADARVLSLRAAAARVRILEEIAAAVQSNVTIPYAVASAQHRMGLGAGGRGDARGTGAASG
jgi:DNA polymerase-3 subunit delta'